MKTNVAKSKELIKFHCKNIHILITAIQYLIYFSPFLNLELNIEAFFLSNIGKHSASSLKRVRRRTKQHNFLKFIYPKRDGYHCLLRQ